ncbi:hypothetical protein SARC_04102 [Sphaeroforma arctica JP610]|uniref:Uncharacterized protein n=1 Tax=Sphaeroforma arctica JP610 TaxID=667725 RepID=A0A0L0G3P6_9EUKA|nr:hypothetical protein SARC_04102 [Sphaeroforma arctica JP610]KNC83670.1 hypothetical protein SARC_04102 [Sphaeroforma arctica JP610]|eukprot:XP_014157572.1 hypothetical protein SARC_04102 [Sphaeroforma arctica JP610]
MDARTTDLVTYKNDGYWSPSNAIHNKSGETEIRDRIKGLRDTARALGEVEESERIAKAFEDRYNLQNDIQDLLVRELKEQDELEHETKKCLRHARMKADEEIKGLKIKLDKMKIENSDEISKLQVEVKSLGESVERKKSDAKYAGERASRARRDLTAATAETEKVEAQIEAYNQRKIELSNQIAEISGHKSSNIMGKTPTKAEFTSHMGQFINSALPIMLDGVLSHEETLTKFNSRLRCCLQDVELQCTQLISCTRNASKLLASNDTALQQQLDTELHKLILQNWDSFVESTTRQLACTHRFTDEALSFLVEAKLWPMLFRECPDFHLISWSTIGSVELYNKAEHNLLEEMDMKNRLQKGDPCTVIVPGLSARDSSTVHKAAVLPSAYGLKG